MTQKRFIVSSIILALSCFHLSACGFQPVYGSMDAANGPIKVLEIEGRIGHRLRQELSRTLGSGLPSVESGAFLTVTARENLQRLNLKSNVGVSRTNIIASASYTLRSVEGEILLSGRVQSETAYDVANSEFGDIELQTDARERVAYLLARRLQEQLTLDATSARQEEQMQNAVDQEELARQEKALDPDSEAQSIRDELDRIQ